LTPRPAGASASGFLRCWRPDAAFDALQAGRSLDELEAYPRAFEASWLHAELQTSKNFKQWFKKGNLVGALMTGVEHWLLPRLGLKVARWTVHRKTPDHAALKPAAEMPRIDYPKPDEVLSFDRLSSVFISNTNHAENQPIHLHLRDPAVALTVNLAVYGGPEARFCPAGVYEFVRDEAGAGAKNPLQLIRLKRKMGNVSNASSETELRGALAWMVGEEGRGVRTIIEMVAITRFDCMIGSAAGQRAALSHALHHCAQRKVFGRLLTEQALMRNVLADLALESEGSLALGMRIARALDRRADRHEDLLARLATAVGKYRICKRTPNH